MEANLSQLSTMKSFVLEDENLEAASFRKRYSQISQIQSYHLFPIRNITSCIDTRSININYKQHSFITLQEHSKKRELLPSQIKSIIWQVTRLMVQCQQKKINHLHLSTKSIVIAKSMYFNEQNQNPFIWVMDFSFGKQFKSVSQGKKLQIFQFLHPSLSIGNNLVNFTSQFYNSQFDIWSFGVVIYYLIYKRSPFRKQGKEIFSKTMLRSFLSGQRQYEIPFHNKKYASINQFISKCLLFQFKEWRQIQNQIIKQEQIYNDGDFQMIPFHQTCQNHLLIAYLFSCIHQMIIQQIRKAVHPFWHFKIQNKDKNFALITSDYILILISNIHKRFISLYKSHFIVLEINNRFDMITQLNTIAESIQNQLHNACKGWLVPKAQGKLEIPLTLEFTKLLQINFMEIILKTGINRKKAKDSGQRQSIVILRSIVQKTQYRRIGGWKSLEILFDFCNEMIQIFNGTKNHMKLFYEFVYTSKVLIDLAVFDFKYPLH